MEKRITRQEDMITLEYYAKRALRIIKHQEKVEIKARKLLRKYRRHVYKSQGIYHWKCDGIIPEEDLRSGLNEILDNSASFLESKDIYVLWAKNMLLE